MRPFRLIASVAALLTLGTGLGVLAPQSAVAQTGTIYVRATASAPGNGTSWASAYPSLQTALQAAASGAEIWLAAGRYTPAPANSSRAATFQLKDGVAIYGGFAGAETARSQRDWAANVVTLSGDLNGNDGSNFANNGENSYHVVKGATGATLDGVTISGGNADGAGADNRGSGMYTESSSPSLTNVTIAGNRATLAGGGIYINRSSPSLINVTIAGNLVVSNSVLTYGGGIYAFESNATLINVIVSGNRAARGGGLYIESNSSPTLTNVTIAGNAATTDGGGIYIFNNTNIQIRNGILWDNSAPVGSAIVYDASTLTASYSLIDGGYAGTGNLNADPQFVTPINPASAPTSAGNLRLRAGSPALDAGNVAVASPALPASDRDGQARVVDLPGVVNGNGGAVDMGAYERQAPGVRYVHAAATGSGSGYSWADAYPSLQEALQEAVSGDELRVAAGRYTPAPANGSRDATFQLKNGVAIYGGFAGTETARSQRNWATHIVTLTGDLQGNDGPNFANNGENSIHVVIGATGATLDGVTISGGNANVDVPGKNAGGGMYNENSSPTLTNVTISGNSSGASGGGMFNSGSSPTLTNATINGNSSANGGGMYNFRSSPTLTNVTFSGNSGGGMYNYVSSSPTLTNVTFSGNSAGSGGGMLNQSSSSPTLTNVTFSGNSAISGFGGGMCNDQEGSPTLTNVTFSGNTANIGGGMYNQSSSSPTLTNVTFSGNSATNGDGGGMLNQSSSPTLTNVTFSGNRARYSGGGMCNDQGNPTLTNVTFSGNTAISGFGGGMCNFDSNPQIRNSIVWGNSASTGPAIFNSSSTPTISYSLIEGGVPSGAVDDGNNLSTDPLFVTPINPASAPTTAGNLRLRVGSPAINAGNNAVASPALPATDRDGNPRIVGGAVDIGAYERLIFTVNLPLVRR